MNDLKTYYLQEMGITPWVLRKAEAEAHTLETLEKIVSSCTLCPLHQSRTQAVFSRGNPDTKLMVIGEAPGFYEDKEGKPFVGKAGKLLDKMLESIGLSENAVYISNVIKCRPPNNRDPHEAEVSLCGRYLMQQIELIKPALIVAVGRFAGQFLLKAPLSLVKMRNQTHSFQNIPVIVTYHPAYLLRNPKDKKNAYQDLLSIKAFI